MEKAYDRVHPDHLLATMEQKGLSKTLILKLIFETNCVSISTG